MRTAKPKRWLRRLLDASGRRFANRQQSGRIEPSSELAILLTAREALSRAIAVLETNKNPHRRYYFDSEIAAWLGHPNQRARGELTTVQILESALNIPQACATASDFTKVGLAMRRFGWRKAQKRIENRRRYVYLRPE